MPKVANYRANSVIYFQGDVSDRVFVLQSGKVSVNYQDIETGKELHELIQTGEFFGVKSALGKYPREENALVVSDAQCLAFTVPEFEVFAQANIRIIMKMLKVFSNQLRRVHKQVDNLLEKGVTQSPEAGLFQTGEYYLKNRQYSQAKYIFGRYLTYYPAGKQAEAASHYLEVAESAAMKYGDGKGPSPIMTGSSRPEGARPAAAPAREAAPARASPQPAARSGSGEGLGDAAKRYYDALSMFSSEKYKEALASFKKIAEEASDPEYTPKAFFDMGRCLFMLQQYDAAVKHFTQVVQTYPKHPDLVDILYYLGQSYGKKGDVERAKGFFKKIISMETDEDASMHMKAKKALRQLEEGGRG
jgi:TolA-binding protein